MLFTKSENVFASAGSRDERSPWVGSNPYRTGVIAGVMTLLIALVSGSVLYQLAQDALRSELRENLMRTAKAAATVVDVEAHGQFRFRNQEQGRAYQAAVRPLEKIRVAAGDIRFIYTCVAVSNEVRFVLDPTPTGDSDKVGTDDKSHIMQAYENPSAMLVEALKSGKATADVEPYRDAWGTFISGYAPFFKSDGRVAGVVGVDLDGAGFVARLASMRRAAWAGTFLALLLSVVAGVGFYRLQARVEHLRKRVNDLNVDLEHKVAERTNEVVSARACLESEVVERRRSEVEALQAKRAAEQANRAKSGFLSTMTHELRTPMNGVIGMANVLLGTALDEEQVECVQIIKGSGESLLALVDNILDYTMVEGEELGTEVLPYDPREVVQTVVGTLEGRARDKNLDVVVNISSDLPGQLVSDVARVRQVLMNLVDNAIKFTSAGSISVEAKVTDRAWDVEGRGDCGQGASLEYVCFSVIDTGVGISPEKQGRLFQEFAQGDDSAARAHGGIGLGLALCKRLVTLMGGEIGVKSVSGQGSAFWFTLPVGACAVPLHLRSSQPAVLPGMSDTKLAA